jgi:LuxR family transcriptional regulator, maltose regulon positive regulatory protein
MTGDLAALEARTEGWIAGLQMAAISMQQTEVDSGNASEFIQAFAGDDRFVMDYLVDEVLSRQPAEVQSFLLKSSVLERFNADLCAALIKADEESGILETHNLLEYLEDANLFLIPLDHRRQWYRYHHLFAELLRNRLVSNHGREYADLLKRRASIWCDENGFPEQAIQYAQAAGDWELSGRLIEQYSSQLIHQSQMLTLIRLVGPIPDAVLRKNPRLCQRYGYALTQCGQLTSGKIYLDHAVQGLQDEPGALGSTYIYSSFNALFRGNYSEQISLAQRGLELTEPDNYFMRGSALLSLGMGLLHSGDPVNAELACQNALKTALQGNNMRTCINALSQLGRIAALGLNFHQAEAYYHRATQYKANDKTFPATDMPLLDLAMLKYEQNELQAAQDYTLLGLETNERSGSIEMRAYGYRLQARLYQLNGNETEALSYLQKAIQLADVHDLSPLTLILNAALQIQMGVTSGNIHQSERAAPHVTRSYGVYPFMFYPETFRVQLLLVQNRKEEALQMLEPVLERVGQPGWEYPRLQVRVLQALAAASPTRAQHFLSEALHLACDSGAIRTFLDLGEPMQVLLKNVAAHLEEPIVKRFAQQLLTMFPGGDQAYSESGRKETDQGLIEPLSEREIEVLRLLADGLSNAEIAHKLYLSPNTLKAHTQNIYSKLDVHSRLQATNRARELKII